MRSGLVAAFVVAVGLSFATPAVAQPPAPVAVAPSGLVDQTGLTFSWRARPGATWYQLWITDSVTSPKFVEWLTAAQVECADGNGLCSATLMLDLAEGHVAWWVRGYSPAGSGPWSAQTNVFVRRGPGAWSLSLPASIRFQLVLDNLAVLDRETGLVWERTPSSQTIFAPTSHAVCAGKSIADKRGWRVPTAAELTSLALDKLSPSDHPFTTPNGYFWTQSVWSSTDFLTVQFGAVFSVAPQNATLNAMVWCVRGATGADR